MNDLQKVFCYQETQVRTIIKDNEPWFVAKDVCEILEYANTRQATSRLDEDEKGVSLIDTPGGTQEMTIINESGLYELILTSRKPEAKLFKRWVKNEVLPTIRKHGAYMTPEKIEEVLYNPDIIIELATKLKEEQQKRKQLQNENNELKPKGEMYDKLISAENNQDMLTVAKAFGMGRNKLFEFLRIKQILMSADKKKNIPYQKYLNAGYFDVREISKQYGNITINIPQTMVTPKGIGFIGKLLKEAGKLNAS